MSSEVFPFNCDIIDCDIIVIIYHNIHEAVGSIPLIFSREIDENLINKDDLTL